MISTLPSIFEANIVKLKYETSHTFPNTKTKSRIYWEISLRKKKVNSDIANLYVRNRVCSTTRVHMRLCSENGKNSKP